ncbi:DUF5104 domain-containing protein [Roseburia sp. 499]|uniref:DUF5104 domain-containing protein n=1 Tax=Roseburia sp. 499 TaxID=1261634 RepID=UPI0009532E8E|nr:DUF5104 domain-containing protein [Roseburia sp. 499]WVK68908.1 DUF5104 domain-containing protein [Roseburia sp. 499]
MKKKIWLQIISGKKLHREKKGITLLLIGSVLIFNLLGCNSKSAEEYRAKVIREDEDMGEKMMQSIVDALEKQDKEALKELFSPYALEHAENLDEKSEKLLEFYQGSDSKREGELYSAEGGKNYGIWILDSGYTLENDGQEYQVRVITIPKYDEEPDKVGLYLIEVMTEEAKPEGFKWRNEDDEPGIYVLEPQEKHYVIDKQEKQLLSCYGIWK